MQQSTNTVKTKTIWVTGASSGIGRAMAEKLAQQGHRVYISGRSSQTLDDIVQQFDSTYGSEASINSGGQLIALPCDVTDDVAMVNLLQQAGVQDLDTIILSAGTCEYIDLPDLDINMIRRVNETNYFGVVNACIAALPMLEITAEAAKNSSCERPHIIGIGSMSSYLGFPRAEAYGSSKAAMSYFLESLRSDLGDRMDVTVVYPGFVKTPMTDRNDFPMPFLVEVDDAADIILRKAVRRPLTIAFPARLNLLLKSMALLPRLWYLEIGKRLRRSGADS